MTKGIKRDLSVEEEIVELDRLLIASLRRNLSLAERLRKGTSDEKGRSLLERHLSRHALLARKGPAAAQEESAAVPESEKRIRRFDRYLVALSDPDLENVMDLVKSMCRSRKVQGPKKSKPGKGRGEKGGEGESSQAEPGT